MAKKNTGRIIEALLFATDKPLSASVIAGITGEPAKKIESIIEKMNLKLKEEKSALVIKEVAGGYQFLTMPEYAPYIKKLYKNRFMARLSRPALEVLSIIAYKQPITKQEVELIRGVNSDGVYHTLLERKLIKITGRKDTPGRPLLYGTTRDFLQYLGVNSLDDMPKIDEIKSILEKDEYIENWEERIEAAKNQASFEFGDEGKSAEAKLIEEKGSEFGVEEKESQDSGLRTQDEDGENESQDSGLKTQTQGEDEEDFEGDEDEDDPVENSSASDESTAEKSNSTGQGGDEKL